MPLLSDTLSECPAALLALVRVGRVPVLVLRCSQSEGRAAAVLAVGTQPAQPCGKGPTGLLSSLQLTTSCSLPSAFLCKS